MARRDIVDSLVFSMLETANAERSVLLGDASKWERFDRALSGSKRQARKLRLLLNDTLKQLYNRFYIPLPMAEAEQEIEACHKQLIERLEKPERKLVLRIMDNQSLIAEQRSMDSFFCGFKLAWELAYELNYFETDRHPFPAEEVERDA